MDTTHVTLCGGRAQRPPTAPPSRLFILKPCPRLVTTPERWMIRPTYIANECVMIMWPKAFPGGRPNMWLLLSYFGYSWKHQTYKANQPSNRATDQPTSHPAHMLGLLLCCDNATKVDDKAHLYCSVGGRRCALVFVLTWILRGYCVSIEHIYIRCQGSGEV